MEIPWGGTFYPPDGPIESVFELGAGTVGVNMGIPSVRPRPQGVSLNDVVKQMHPGREAGRDKKHNG